jgi:hypothetical protein
VTIAAADVRNYLTLNTDSTSRYSDATIRSNIQAGQEFLRKATNRYFEPASGVTLTLTSNGNSVVDLPGVRSVTSVTQAGSALTADETYWLLPDDQGSGVYTGLQLRAFISRPGAPWWLSVPDWFDRNLDSPYYPANMAGGYGSLPNDLVIVADVGYLDANLPASYLLALKFLAAILTLSPHTTVTNTISSADGLPQDIVDAWAFVQRFIEEWRVGTHSAVSV